MQNFNQQYELYLIFSPSLSAEEVNTKVSELEAMIKPESWEVESQGLKKMAYPIDNHTTGFYVLINFDLALEKARDINNINKKFSTDESIVRNLLVNQTDFIKQQSKEKERGEATEIVTFRDLNKGRVNNKKCLSKHLGLRAIDYKDIEYLNQFTSPYSKIFGRDRTGSSAKFQRKITQAIKRARHMALMSFTAKWMD